jgi:hypothetical protein
MGVKVAFRESTVEAEEAPQAMSLVPSNALRRDGDRRVAFLVNGDTVERRAVSVGRELDGETEILSGVTVGSTIVVEPPAELEDGQKIKVSG